MADDTKTEEKAKPATQAELQAQLEAAKAELAGREQAELALEYQLAKVLAKLNVLQTQENARGSIGGEEVDGVVTFKSTVTRPEWQNAKLAEVYPFTKPGCEAPTVTLKSFLVQDAAGANKPVRVDGCCDESEAKRVVYQRLGVSPRDIKLKAVAVEVAAKSKAAKAAVVAAG